MDSIQVSAPNSSGSIIPILNPTSSAFDFAIRVPPQNLTVYASPDTKEASIALLQGKVGKLYARTERGVDGWALVFKMSFGPCGAREVEYADSWYGTQRFVSFAEGEPFLDGEDDGSGEEEPSDADEKARQAAPPMFETDADGKPIDESPTLAKKEPVRRTLHKPRQQEGRWEEAPVRGEMLIRADARALPLRDGCVNCVVTSPPYWGLRDYGTTDQIGLEATPDDYVESIVRVFVEVWRVLRDDGVVWLNLGDCYATGAGKVGECPGGSQARRAVARGCGSSARREAGVSRGATPERTRVRDGAKGPRRPPGRAIRKGGAADSSDGTSDATEPYAD